MSAEDFYKLLEMCENQWLYLSSGVFTDTPNYIVRQIKGFSNNPLIVSLTSILLFVAGVDVFCRIVRAIISRRV